MTPNSIINDKNMLAERFGVPKENISQSFLRAEALLATQDSVKLYFNKNENTANIATQKLLKSSDSFIITHLAMCLKKVASDTPANHVSAILHTYANPSVFYSSGEAAALNAVYNGQTTLKADNVDFTPALQNRWFERVHTSQQGTTTTAYVNASSADATTTIARSERTNGLDGFFPVDNIGFNGDSKFDVVVDLGTSINLAGTSSSNYLVVMAIGYLVSNKQLTF